ncbi:MAG: TetR/AcrR family transcriptional regulator [Saprospiraceae bacterium]|nr:TetR/AcrR family transcriptional regulator [Saprospiraceae bacterium]MBK8671218.1 TetR/AcrR family transcriptional regulator [Saprospiraceae bacterium]
MHTQLFKFSANVNTDIYIKDPESSQIGQSILKDGLELIDELGFEDFTFRKLGVRIGTTEATIYRYFENKHKLLLYFTSWYWCWIEYQLVLKNTNIHDPSQRLNNAIKILATLDDYTQTSLNLPKLFNIICRESSKSYLTINVRDLNSYGVFYNYKKIVSVLSDLITEINPDYPYPHMLITTIIEGIHHQIYFADHLPGLTDKVDDAQYLINFYYQLALKAIKPN